MKKTFLTILALAGLAAQDDGKQEFSPTQEQLDSIKSQLEKGNKAISDLATAGTDLSIATEAKKTAEDALAAKESEITALKAEKKTAEESLAAANAKLEKFPAEETDPKTERQDSISSVTVKKFEDYAHNKKMLKELGEA